MLEGHRRRGAATFRDPAATAQRPVPPDTGAPHVRREDDRFAEYKNKGPGAGGPSGDRPHLSDAQAAAQETADWLGGWKPAN